MSKVIAVNSGSSSLKFQLFQMPEEKVLTSGQAERIGLEMGIFTINVNGEKVVTNTPIPDHQAAVDMLLESLVKHGIVKDLNEIEGAGHRIVQGGPYFKESVKVDEDVVFTEIENEKINQCTFTVEMDSLPLKKTYKIVKK